MQNPNYEQMISAAVAGNESAFRRLYDISSGKAYYAALCITKSEKDAVNIMQSSYSTMRERLPRLKYPQMFENWFYRIVCKCIYGSIAFRSPALFDSFNSLEVDAFDDELYGEYFPMEDSETAQRDRVTVTKILDRLPLDRRLCFLMYYYFKMNVAEISKIISVDETIIAYFLNEGKKIVKANIKDALVSQNRTVNCTPVVFYTSVLLTCTSHVPFRATDMIFGNIFNSRPRADVHSERESESTRQVTVSENDSTQMYSGEEIEELLKNSRSSKSGAYGKESSKGGDGDDDIPAAKSAAKIIKIVLAVLIAIIFIVTIVALLKNVISDNNETTSATTQETTVEAVTSERETVATTAQTTQAPTTTEAPTTAPETQTEAPSATDPEPDTMPYFDDSGDISPQPVEPGAE